MTPMDALGRITTSFTPSKNLALKVEHEPRKKVVKEESSDDEDNEDLASMIKTTMKLMNQLNKKGLEYNNKIGRHSPKGEHSDGRIKCYDCGEKGHIAPKCSKPKSIKIGPRARARQSPARRRTSRTVVVPMLVSGSPTTTK